ERSAAVSARLHHEHESLEEAAAHVGHDDLGLDPVPFDHGLNLARDGPVLGPVDHLIERLVEREERGDAGPQCLRELVQGRERWARLVVLDLRDQALRDARSLRDILEAQPLEPSLPLELRADPRRNLAWRNGFRRTARLLLQKPRSPLADEALPRLLWFS